MPVQPFRAVPSICLRFSPRLIVVREAQSSNTLSPNELTLSKTILVFRFTHPAKAPLPINEIVVGILILVRLLQFSKVLLPIEERVEGKITFAKLLQL